MFGFALLLPLLLGPVTASAATDAVEAGLSAYGREAYGEAYRLWIDAAEAGDGEAQFHVSRLFEEGRGVAPNAAESMRWLRYAARGGFSPAQYELGERYRTGQGVTQDPSRALYWWTQAAEAGHGPAQYGLALLYARGEGVARDGARARQWTERATASGVAGAEALLEGAPPRAPTTAGDGPGLDLEWVLGEPPDRFTLQVFSSRSRVNAQRAAGLVADGLPRGVFPFVVDGLRWYGVVVGSEARREDAEALVQALPGPLRETGPFARRFERVQEAARRALSARLSGQ
jgi:septal ring-binding cell division protein DamX